MIDQEYHQYRDDDDDRQYLDGSYSDFDDDEYFEESFRDDARIWAEAADESFLYYRIAVRSGDEGTAKEFYDEVKYCQNRMNEANDTAADLIFERNNENQPSHIIDLHRLFVNEAIVKLTVRVNNLLIRSKQELIVIVGRGHHSEHGPKLKNAVANFAIKNNILYSADPLTTGRVELHLDDVSPLQLNESDSDSSMLYNRSNEVTLSEFITQAQQKNSTKIQIAKRSQNVKQKKRKCNAQKVKDHSNKMPSSVKPSQIKRKDATHIVQHVNIFGDSGPHLRQPLKNKTNTTQRTSDRLDEVSSPVNTSKNQQNNGIQIPIVKRFQNLKQKEKKRHSQKVRKYTNYISQHTNESEYHSYEFCFVFVLIGVMIVAKFCGAF